jgi:translation initiation factor IF-2
MSIVKYRVKELAADFGITPKEVSEIISKYFEKPKSYTQVLTAEELNVFFDHITLHNQIASLAVVFDVKPKEQPKQEAPKAEVKENPKQEAP